MEEKGKRIESENREDGYCGYGKKKKKRVRVVLIKEASELREGEAKERQITNTAANANEISCYARSTQISFYYFFKIFLSFSSLYLFSHYCESINKLTNNNFIFRDKSFRSLNKRSRHRLLIIA
jgi:hypothetical protein